MQGIAQKILANPGKYSIQQLQQGVERGIIPAYIAVPLIQEKVQMQKQMQMAQAMQQGAQQEQMPVAARVMQEAQGVDGLPTGLPTQYAHGGIVAFEEGGPVERYQNKGYVYETPYDRMNRENREREEAERMAREAQAREQGIMPYGEQMRNVGSALLNAPINAFKYLVSAPGGPGLLAPGTPSASPAAVDNRAAINQADAASRAAPPAAPIAGDQPRTDRPKSGIDNLLGSKPLTSAFSAPPKGPSMVDTVERQLYGNETEPGFLARSEARERTLLEELGKNRLQGKAFEGLEASLKKEAEEAGADRKQAKDMAMLKAGLAMMAGTSRHALENIGKGAMVGTEDYQAAVKDLKKAEKERQRQFAYIEQARRAESQDDLKRRDTLLYKANESAQKRDEFGTNAIINATGKDREQATDIWKTQFGAEKAVQVAQIGAGATLGAAAMRANQREGITPYQLARLRADAEKQVDPNAIRAQLVQQLKLSKAPKPGADPTFEQRFQQLYEAAISDRVNRNLGYGFGGAGGGQGFKLPQGYKLLGAED